MSRIANMQGEEDAFFEDVDCGLPAIGEVVADAVAVDAVVTATSVPIAGNPSAADTILPSKKQKRVSVPNYKSEEVVATVWAYIAMSEEEQIQTFAAQLTRLERLYLPKAKELHRLGRWPLHGSRTPEESAEIRAKNPSSLHARAKKAIEVIVNVICPIWSAVKREQQSGWGKEDFIRETKKR
jgi:hypothetical protein